MALTHEEQARLNQLEAARDAQISGRAVAKVSGHGRSVDHAPADVKRLEGEIEVLRAKAQRGGGRKRGALTFRWSR